MNWTDRRYQMFIINDYNSQERKRKAANNAEAAYLKKQATEAEKAKKQAAAEAEKAKKQALKEKEDKDLENVLNAMKEAGYPKQLWKTALANAVSDMANSLGRNITMAERAELRRKVFFESFKRPLGAGGDVTISRKLLSQKGSK